ncbi:MAG: MarR family transcriptional regulator [Elainellaceae cyanobacterium]
MFELVGLPRMSGRIFGWLLISDPPQQSTSELVEVLQASKGSISTMTRLLIQIGLIERVSLPGERRDYFQIKPHAWAQMTKQRIAQINAFRQLAEKGLTLLADTPPSLQERLQEMRDIHAFWERELPLLDQRWETEQEKRWVKEQETKQ